VGTADGINGDCLSKVGRLVGKLVDVGGVWFRFVRISAPVSLTGIATGLWSQLVGEDVY
jgi:hypothetical protein